MCQILRSGQFKCLIYHCAENKGQSKSLVNMGRCLIHNIFWWASVLAVSNHSYISIYLGSWAEVITVRMVKVL